MENPQVKAVLFDLDDTLVDAYSSIEAATNFVLHKHGMRRLMVGQLDSLAGHAPAEGFRKIGAPEELIPQMVEEYHEATAFHLAMVKRYPDSLFVLQWLNKHDIRVGVVTSRSKLSTKQVLSSAGLDSLVDAIVALGDTEEPKPSPAPFLLCSRKLAAKPGDCLVVGDGFYDIKAGKAAGMKTVWAKYGSGGRHEMQMQPDFTINRLNELLELPVLGNLA